MHEADGVLTGYLARAAARRRGARRVAGPVRGARRASTSAKSYAYGDSVADLPWLALVGTPTAVNPDARLAREALRRRWRILDWRRGGVTRADLDPV